MSRILKVSQGNYKLQVQPGGQIVLDTGISGTVSIPGVTPSYSKTTGSLVVAGGAGVAGDVFMGKLLSLTVSTVAPEAPSTGMFAIADRVNWNPAAKSGIPVVPYPVFYDGQSWNALY